MPGTRFYPLSSVTNLYDNSALTASTNDAIRTAFGGTARTEWKDPEETHLLVDLSQDVQITSELVILNKTITFRPDSVVFSDLQDVEAGTAPLFIADFVNASRGFTASASTGQTGSGARYNNSTSADPNAFVVGDNLAFEDTAGNIIYEGQLTAIEGNNVVFTVGGLPIASGGSNGTATYDVPHPDGTSPNLTGSWNTVRIRRYQNSATVLNTESTYIGTGGHISAINCVFNYEQYGV